MTQIRHRRTLITGAASGLGRLMARRFSQEGARLVLVDIDEPGLAETAKVVGECETFVCDVSDREQVATLGRQVGPVDVLVNNAGVIGHGAYASLGDGDDERMLGVNVAGVHWLTKTFYPHLVASEEGHIVMMSSVAGIVGIPYQALYSATKWFVMGLGESLRQELRADGHRHVRVTIVCPSIVDTGFYDHPRAPLLVPILTSELVVDRITEAVRKNRPYVREPFMVKLAPFLRGVLPSRGADMIASLLRIQRVVPREPRGARPPGGAQRAS